MKRLIAALVVPVALFLSACSSSDTGETADDSTSVAESTSAAVSGATWEYIRTEYAQILSQSDCGEGPQQGVCNQLRNSDLKSLRIDAAELPMSKTRTDFISTIDGWDEQYAKYDDALCLGSLNTPDNVKCSVSGHILDLKIMTLDALAKGATD